jgi:hypothetical protein
VLAQIFIQTTPLHYLHLCSKSYLCCVGEAIVASEANICYLCCVGEAIVASEAYICYLCCVGPPRIASEADMSV